MRCRKSTTGPEIVRNVDVRRAWKDALATSIWVTLCRSTMYYYNSIRHAMCSLPSVQNSPTLELHVLMVHSNGHKSCDSWPSHTQWEKRRTPLNEEWPVSSAWRKEFLVWLKAQHHNLLTSSMYIHSLRSQTAQHPMYWKSCQSHQADSLQIKHKQLPLSFSSPIHDWLF